MGIAKNHQGLAGKAHGLLAVEFLEVDEGDRRDGDAPSHLDDFLEGLERAARGHQIVDEEDAAALGEAIRGDLDGRRAVFEGIGSLDRRSRELAGLAAHDEAYREDQKTDEFLEIQIGSEDILNQLENAMEKGAKLPE